MQTNPGESCAIGCVLHDTYRIERLLGEGGMGTVYEVSHLRLRRRFAVKLLLPSVAAFPEAVARFRREGEITSEIGHPNIVEIIDSNVTSAGAPYIVMELLEGESLGSRLERDGHLSLPQTSSILRQTASALHAAHRLGIVHRDLKPENIFLCRRPEQDDFVKVLDFGISKVLGSTSMVTAATTLMGTPNFMAPEQAEGRAAEVDARADIFATGAIIFTMLTGRPPFEGDTIPAVLYQVVHQDPPTLRSLGCNVPPSVEEVVRRALSKQPGDRQPTIERFAQELCAAAEARPAPAASLPPVPVRGISSGVRAPRISRRVLGPGIVLAALVLTGVAGSVALRRTAPPLAQPRAQATLSPTPAPTVAARTASRSSPPDAAPAPPRAETADAPDAGAAPLDAELTQTSPDAAPSRSPGRVGRGRLRVVTQLRGSSLWADVYLDGRRLGQSPLLLESIPAGQHTLTVRRSGFRSETRRVRIAPRRETVIRLELRP